MLTDGGECFLLEMPEMLISQHKKKTKKATKRNAMLDLRKSNLPTSPPENEHSNALHFPKYPYAKTRVLEIRQPIRG